MKALTVATASLGSVSASGAQSAVAVGTEDAVGISIVSTSVTAGATLTIEGRAATRDGSGAWFPVEKVAIAAAGTMSLPLFTNRQKSLRRGKSIEEYRVNVPAADYTDGTHVCVASKITH